MKVELLPQCIKVCCIPLMSISRTEIYCLRYYFAFAVVTNSILETKEKWERVNNNFSNKMSML
jgi:hypothetical protein